MVVSVNPRNRRPLPQRGQMMAVPPKPKNPFLGKHNAAGAAPPPRTQEKAPAVNAEALAAFTKQFDKPEMTMSDKLSLVSGMLMDYDGSWGEDNADKARGLYDKRVAEAQGQFDTDQQRQLLTLAAQGDPTALALMDPLGAQQFGYQKDKDHKAEKWQQKLYLQDQQRWETEQEFRERTQKDTLDYQNRSLGQSASQFATQRGDRLDERALQGMVIATPEAKAAAGLDPTAPYMQDGYGEFHLIEGAENYGAGAAEAAAARRHVPGFPPPPDTGKLTPGIASIYTREDGSAITDAREAAAASRSRATLTQQFVDKADGYLAQGQGWLNDLGQTFSMRTSGLNQLSNKLGPQSRPEGSGSTSDKDMAVYMQSTVNVNNTPGTNKDVAAMENAIADADAAYSMWMQDYTAAYASQPGASREAKRQWDRYVSAPENQMFSLGEDGRVVVKERDNIIDWIAKNPGPGAATSNEPVQIAGDDDFDALPSGTIYVGPDGIRRTKP